MCFMYRLATKAEDIRWRWTEALSYEKKEGSVEYTVLCYWKKFQ